MISPAQSYYNPATAPVTMDIQDVSECMSHESPATMDRYLAEDGDLLLDDCPCCPCRCYRFQMPMYRLRSLPRLPQWGGGAVSGVLGGVAGLVSGGPL